MLTCLGNIEETLVLVPSFSSFMSSQDANDVSLMGWGAILEGRSSQGLWKDHHLSWHINCLEMLAVFLALNNFLVDLSGHHELVHSVNTSVVSYKDHPYSINCGYLLFFETTIMGNTADLAMVQKTIIDTLHKEGKSQRVITERGGCSRSAVSKHIKCKVDWKKEIG